MKSARKPRLTIEKDALETPISRITSLSGRDRATEESPEQGIASARNQAIFDRLCGKTIEGKRLSYYSTELLVRESIPADYPLLTAMELLIDAFEGQQGELETAQQALEDLEISIDGASPQSASSENLAETYNEKKKAYDEAIFRRLRTGKKKEMETAQKALEIQRSKDDIAYKSNIRDQIKDTKSYIHKVETKMIQFKFRIEELVEEYFSLLGELEPSTADLIKKTAVHSRIICIHNEFKQQNSQS